MKRIKAACLLQTVHFQLKDNLGHAAAVKNVQDEYAAYKLRLEKTRTKFQIVREETQPDGSIIIEIKKQYNNHDCGKYID
ncbi:MAG: hypothetical protein IJD03_01455 [Clostridia bacterium]|nr:hypothetical protein [Clostridia bacterium]